MELSEAILQVDQVIETLETEKVAIDKDLEAAKTYRAVLVRKQGAAAPAPAMTPVAAQMALQPKTDTLDKVDEYGAVTRNIWAAIEASKTAFTVYDIERALVEQSIEVGRDTISQALSRWGRSGRIMVKAKGEGRRPSVYYHLKFVDRDEPSTPPVEDIDLPPPHEPRKEGEAA